MQVAATAGTRHDYRVAAYPLRRGQSVGETPEGKRHAYRKGARVTVCGFGLREMRIFDELRFSEQLPAVRCTMCARIVRAAER